MHPHHAQAPIVLLRSFTGARALPLALALVLMLPACETATTRLEQVDTETATLTTAVKAALISDDAVDAAAILVTDTDSGIVLEGFVASEQEKSRALELAREAAAPQTVIDRLDLR